MRTSKREFVSIREFLDSYGTRTVNSYRSGLTKFCEFIGISPERFDSKSYFMADRDFDSDAKRYFAYLLDVKGLAPKTATCYFAGVKEFFIENDQDLRQKTLRDIRKKLKQVGGANPITEDRVPNSKELQLIFGNLDVKGKALFGLVASTGCRIGEALELEPDDINWNYSFEYTNEEGDSEYQKIPRVVFRREITKTKLSRTSFLNKEASQLVRNWLKVREDYLVRSSQRQYFNERKLDKLFATSKTTAETIWNTALRKARLDHRDTTSKHSRRIFRIHGLRKRFISILREQNIEMAETLAGHEGYLTKSYRRHSTEKLAKWFYKYGSMINVQSNGVNDVKLRYYEKNINRLNDELAKKTSLLTIQETRIEKLEKMYDKVFNVIESGSGTLDIIKNKDGYKEITLSHD